MLFFMVIDTACLGQEIFLNSRSLEERAMGESRINYLAEQAALPPQKRVLENSVEADLQRMTTLPLAYSFGGMH